MVEVIGQLLGIAAVAFGFISYQMKTSRGILIFQLTTALIFSAHYLLIGALTAMALNLLGAVSCVFYFFRDKRGDKSIIEPIVFIALAIAASILTWEGWYSALIMSGLVVNSISLILSNAQKTRLCMFLKSPLCLIYNNIRSSYLSACQQGRTTIFQGMCENPRIFDVVPTGTIGNFASGKITDT